MADGINEVQESLESAKAAQDRVIPELVKRIAKRRALLIENGPGGGFKWTMKDEAKELHYLADDLMALSILRH